MPTSHFSQISKIVEIIFRLRPVSVLDVGIGYGKYGMLAREYLEFGIGYKPFQERRIKIDGIEAFPDYIGDGQRFYYDNIYQGEALEILPRLGSYDLILLVDVLEHFEREQGIALLEACAKKSQHTIVSTPHDIGVQGAVYGNEFERHRYQWKKSDFAIFKDVTYFRIYHSLFFVIGPRGKGIRDEMQRANFKLSLRSTFPAFYRWYKKLRYGKT
jgi:SAM-dependent methyltransferase